MASRPEDRNAKQLWSDFTDGATLAQLEAFIRRCREEGAPDDAHPQVGRVNEDNEITGMVCVVNRQD